MFKKTQLVIAWIVFCASSVYAADISTLVEKRISEDRKTLDLTGLNIGPQGAKELASMKSLSSAHPLKATTKTMLAGKFSRSDTNLPTSISNFHQITL